MNYGMLVKITWWFEGLTKKKNKLSTLLTLTHIWICLDVFQVEKSKLNKEVRESIMCIVQCEAIACIGFKTTTLVLYFIILKFIFLNYPYLNRFVEFHHIRVLDFKPSMSLFNLYIYFYFNTFSLFCSIF